MGYPHPKSAGQSFYFYIWAFMCAFTLFINTIFPTFIQPLFNTFTSLEDGDLKVKIQKLATRISFPLGKIFVIDGSKRSSHSNAYFYGLWNDKRIVLFDTLLTQCTHEEIIAILGHELGHWAANHQWKRLFTVQIHLFLTFYFFNMIMDLKSLFAAFGFETQPVIIGFIIFQFLYTPIEVLAILVVNSQSRSHEYEADKYAKTLGYATALKSGLKKLYVKNLGNMNPDGTGV